MKPQLETSIACLAQADLFLLLAGMLEPPTSWEKSHRVACDEDLEALAKRSGLARLPEGTSTLKEAMTSWRTVELERAVANHHRLFDGAQACPPNETAYVRRDKGAILADIAGFYRAFGFELAGEFQEKHDHVSAEMQFAALLLVLLERAIDSGKTDEREVTRDALSGFLTDHLGAWVHAFEDRLEATCGLPFYAAVPRLSRVVWETVRNSLQLPEVESPALPLIREAGTPYECGLCAPEATTEA